MTEVKATVRGGKECKEKLEQVKNDLTGKPMVAGMRTAALLVSGEAKKRAPADTGVLAASITPDVRSEGGAVQGVVGSNKEYAPYMELGTGVFVGRKPHRPPAAALETWARRHGTTGAAVAFAIAKRGGLKPRRFLQSAFEDNRAAVVTILENAVKGIVNE